MFFLAVAHPMGVGMPRMAKNRSLFLLDLDDQRAHVLNVHVLTFVLDICAYRIFVTKIFRYKDPIRGRQE